MNMVQFARFSGVVRKAFSSQLGRNIISNYLTVVWMGGLSLALVPLYLRTLGPAQWGLVAACMSLQAFMSLLDMGLSQVMPRDVARIGDHRPSAGGTFLMFSRAYLALGVMGCAMGQLAVPWIVRSWLHQDAQGPGNISAALRLVLLQFLFQFANNAHTGYWSGMQAQQRANLRQCGFATAKHASALATIFFWEASALAYLIPFVLVSAAEFALNRRAVFGETDFAHAAQPRREDYRRLAAQAGLLASGVLVGMMVSQVDRIVLARAVDIASFGRYVIVANLGLAFMQLQYPLVRAYFPRIVLARAGKGSFSIRQLAASIAILCVLPCTLVGTFAPSMLSAWTRDAAVAREGAAPLRLILAAVAINAVYQLIYQRILSHGAPQLVLKINLLVLVSVVPTAVFATQSWGITGGGLTWLVGATVQLAAGLFLSRKGNL